MSRIKLVVLLVIISALGILIYWSPDEAYGLRDDPDEAVKVGRLYAYDLLYADRDNLLEMSVEPATSKLRATDLAIVNTSEMFSQLEKVELRSLATPLVVEERDEHMRLMAYERLSNFIVMTFAYQVGDGIVEIPAKGKLLYSVAVRYYKPSDDRLIPKLARKIANLPLVRNFTGRLGTTGRWVVFDYYYKYDLNDYFTWALEDGRNYSQNRAREAAAFTKQLEQGQQVMESLKKSTDRSLEFLYDWGSITTEKQIETIGRLHEIEAESSNDEGSAPDL